MENETLKRIENWMSNNLHNYIDECGEINYTKMSEDAIQKFNVDENHEDDVFSIAAEINL